MYPCGFQPLTQALGQAGFAAQSVGQPVQGTQQAVPNSIEIKFIVAQDRDKITCAGLEQLDQPMLYLDILVCPRFT